MEHSAILSTFIKIIGLENKFLVFLRVALIHIITVKPPLKVHLGVSNGVRNPNFSLSFHLNPYLVCANSKGSGETMP